LGLELRHRVEEAVRTRIVGQAEVLDHLLVALLAGGHVLLEGLPGLAKTLLARTLASTVDASFRRIQFTPDLLPSDILGSLVYQEETSSFVPAPGPIFANLVLADEINRAPPKVQSALLEAMEEEQVSLGGETFRLRSPFMVLATQNPLEHHGTYPLSEAQVDRFMMLLRLGYPGRAEEMEILRGGEGSGRRPPPPVVTTRELLAARTEVGKIHVDDALRRYVVDLVRTTREEVPGGVDELRGLLAVGASPRSGLALQRAARARAFLAGRPYVLPQDVKFLAPAVLRHRLLPSYEARDRGLGPDEILEGILHAVPAP
jgi:MoxR-like ATPase